MTLNEYITLGISTVAIVISIIAYLQNSRIEKRQVRIEKLEEMLEITHILMGNYQYFEDTHSFKTHLSSQSENSSKDKERYVRQLKELIQIAESIKLQNMLTRLFVLNNSYLPKKELKEKIGVLITVYTNLAQNTISQQSIPNVTLPFNSFPKKWEFLEFTQEIQNALIEEMDLGYKDSINHENTYDKIFKERYNIQ